MVAVQNLIGEIIQLILSRKGGGVYLVSTTPTKLQSLNIIVLQAGGGIINTEVNLSQVR